MLTDMFVYDWWSLIMGWATVVQGSTTMILKQANWVRELMSDGNVRALPRSMEQLGRCYDTREFWSKFNLTPTMGRAK
jgi:hypothetical protein